MAIIAAIARYHRGSEPKVTHEAWYTLDLEGRKLVHDLAAFLRIAEALDRSHRQVVRDLRVMVNASHRDNKVLNLLLSLHEAETAQSEIWALGEKKAFFEMHFQVSLDVLVQADALVSAPPND